MPAIVVDFGSDKRGKEAVETFAEEILQAYGEKLILLFFYALWCGPCRTIINDQGMLPLVIREASEDVVICNIDVDEDQKGNHAVADFYKVRALPTIVFVKNGRDVVDWVTGAVSGELILRSVKKRL